MGALVTILLTTYNRAYLISETLESIRAQTYQNWECIIIDDHSTDNTEVYLLDNYISKDHRFSYYKKDLTCYKKGLGGSRNQSLDLASQRKAEYIQFFDDDDIMHPQKLELQLLPFFKDKTLDMTLCMYRTFDKKLIYNFNLDASDDGSCNIISNNLFWDFYYSKINLNSLGPIWKLSSIKGFKFDEDLVTGEERDFYLRIFLKKRINYKSVNAVLFWYRKHQKSITKGSYALNKNYNASLFRVRNKIIRMIVLSERMPFSIRLKFLIKLIFNS